jgi:lipopolysaccharide exporter
MSSLNQSLRPAVRSGSYVLALGMNAASAGFTQIIGFVRSLILARLLAPEDYGVFGMAFVVTSAVQVLVNFNMTSNVIRRKFQSDPEMIAYLNTTWTVELIRQALVSLVLLLLSYPASLYFHNSRVFAVLALCSLTPLLTGFTNVGLVLLRKEVNFKNVILHRQTSEILMTVLAILFALVTRNVWALAISQVLGALLSALLSYKFHPYRPSFVIDRQVLRESFSFSFHLFLVSIFTYVTTQFDNLVVGRYLGASVVGAYMLAYRLANLPCEAMTDVLSPVLFPVYSRIRHETPDALLHTSEVAFVSATAAILAFTVPLRLSSEWLIRLVYGHKWSSAAPMLSILVFVGILRGMARAMAPLFLSLERPAVESSSKAVEGVIFIALTLYLVPRYQTTGAAIAGIVSYFIALNWRVIAAVQFYGRHVLRLLLRTGLTCIAAVFAYGAALSLRSLGAHELLVFLSFDAVFVPLFLTIVPSARQKLFGIIRRTVQKYDAVGVQYRS